VGVGEYLSHDFSDEFVFSRSARAFRGSLPRSYSQESQLISGDMNMNRIKTHFLFSLHNLVGHPLMEVFHLFGLERASKWIHDITLFEND